MEATRLGGPTLEALEAPAPSAADAPSPAAVPPAWPRNQAEMLLAQRWVPHAEEVEAQQAQQAERGARDAETGLSPEEAGKLGTIGVAGCLCSVNGGLEDAPRVHQGDCCFLCGSQHGLCCPARFVPPMLACTACASA